MPSPMPRDVRWNERFIPSPKERRSTIESVPQPMAITVRPMRLRLRAASTRKRRQTRRSSALVTMGSGQLERDHGVEHGGAARGEVAGGEADDAEEGGGGEDHEGGGLRGAHVLVELVGEDRDHAEGDEEAEHAAHG